MIYANDYIRLNDNDTIEAAIAAKDADGIVVISRRVSDVEPSATFGFLTVPCFCPKIRR